MMDTSVCLCMEIYVFRLRVGVFRANPEVSSTHACIEPTQALPSNFFGNDCDRPFVADVVWTPRGYCVPASFALSSGGTQSDEIMMGFHRIGANTRPRNHH